MTQDLQFTLNTGAKLPAVGLGCWMGRMGEGLDRCEAMVATALKVGYRAFDTAAGYGNEEAVGRAINAAGIPREEVFVTTKLRNVHHHCVAEALEQSLNALNLGYIDLWLMHWPIAVVDGKILPPEAGPTIVDVWREMEKALASGKVKAIGVSNFSIARLQTLLDECTIVPAVNQVELHPSLPQFELVDWCRSKGIQVTAYSSLGQPGGRPAIGALEQPDVFFRGDPLKSVAEKHNASVGQVLLSWAVQRGVSVIPKSENEGRLKSNLTVITLDSDDVGFLNNWHKGEGMHRSLCPYHSVEPVVGAIGWTYEQLHWTGMTAGGVITTTDPIVVD